MEDEGEGQRGVEAIDSSKTELVMKKNWTHKSTTSCRTSVKRRRATETFYVGKISK